MTTNREQELKAKLAMITSGLIPEIVRAEYNLTQCPEGLDDRRSELLNRVAYLQQVCDAVENLHVGTVLEYLNETVERTRALLESAADSDRDEDGVERRVRHLRGCLRETSEMRDGIKAMLS